MSTTIRFERNALMSAAHLTDSDDGGSAFVFCSIPGGTPMFAFSRDGLATSVTNAPQCNTHRSFVAFVTARFGS
jgi:hypothetical protein